MADYVGNDNSLFAERMLEEGYFPESVPPVFTVTNLHEAALGPLATDGYLSNPKTPTEGVRYNASKRGGQRRAFTLPNPVFMVDAANYFIRHQDQVQAHLASADRPVSYPVFKVEGRPLAPPNFAEIHSLRRRKLAQSRYVVRTDISRYFHSIYTHSLPWALHGKTAAKRDRKIDSGNVFGNRLDWLLRQAQDGQTVGIPVGPDFSRLVSEVIGAAIDQNYQENRPSIQPMLRMVDDVYIGADNIDEAQAHLSAFRDSIRAFELDINDAKTTIVEASADLEPFWPVELRREVERYGDASISVGARRSDFVHFLDEVLRRATANKDDGIVKFVVRQIDKQEVWQNFWDVLEPFLIRVVISFPHCWDYAAQVVAWRNRLGHVDAALWEDVIHRSIRRHGSSGHDSEVAWALWLLKELGAGLAEDALTLVAQRCGAMASLLALDVNASSAEPKPIPRETILNRLGERPMCGSQWLLAYEGDRQFGFRIKSRNVQGNDFFAQLYDDDVSFYDRGAEPFTFKNVGDPAQVRFAIDGRVSSYDIELEDEEEAESFMDGEDF